MKRMRRRKLSQTPFLHFHDLEPSCSFFRPSIFDLFYLFFFFCCAGTLVKFLNGGHQVVKWLYTTGILLWPRVQSGLLASEIETQAGVDKAYDKASDLSRYDESNVRVISKFQW
jgi:hypothetical protein